MNYQREQKIQTLLICVLISVMQPEMMYAQAPEIKIALGHAGRITQIVQSPNGKYILSSSRDRSIKLWDFKSGRELRRMIDHEGWVNTVGWSPDSRYAVSCGYNGDSGSIRLWDVASGKLIHRFSPEENDSFFCAIFLSNTVILSQSYKGVYAIDTVTYSIHKLFSVDSTVTDEPFVLSPNGKYLASKVYKDGVHKLVVYDLMTNKLFREINDFTSGFCFSSEIMYIVSDQYLERWDYVNNKSIRVAAIESNYISNSGIWPKITVSPDNENIIFSYAGMRHGIFNLNTKSFNKEYPGDCESFSLDGQSIIYGDRDGIVQIDRLSDPGVFESRHRVVGLTSMSDVFYTNVYFTDHEFIYEWNPGEARLDCTYSDKTYQVDNGLLKLRGKTKFEEWGYYVLSDDKKIALKTSELFDYSLCLYDTNTGLIKKKYDLSHCYPVAIRKDNRAALLWSGDNGYFWFDLEVEKIIKELPISDYDNPYLFDEVSRDKKYLAVLSPGRLLIWNLIDGVVVWEKVTTWGNPSGLSFDSDNKYILLGSDNYSIMKIDISTGEVIENHASFGIATSFSSNTNCTRYFSTSLDGAIRYWDANSGALIYSAIASPNGDYLAWTPEGFFSGSEELARDAVYIQDGNTIIDIGQFYELFYRPDLVEAKIAGKDISNYANKINLAALIHGGLPPEVEFVTQNGTSSDRDIKIKLRVKDMGGGVGRITLSLDGMPIVLGDGGRGMTVLAEKSPREAASHEYETLITLRGGTNHIELYANNAANSMESRRASLDLVYRNAVVAKPNLHILAIAINKYRDKSLWLNYSIADAEAITTALKAKAGNLYGAVSVNTLYDSQVTKDGFSRAFDALKGNVGSDDVFVLYLAGHGVTNDLDGDYYYIPSDFRYTDSTDIPMMGISKKLILENLSKIQSKKTVLLFDTCNSGSFIDKPATRAMAEKTAIDRLKRAVGRTIIVASSESQVAMEGYEGHGVFTYALLQGLDGAADPGKKGVITITDLCTYIENAVPELTYKKWGYEQIPMKELPTVDFPLVMEQRH